MTRATDSSDFQGSDFGGVQLTAADAAAVDAWMDGRGGGGDLLNGRTACVHKLMGLLDGPFYGAGSSGEQSRTLADVVMARVARAGAAAGTNDTLLEMSEARLSGDDVEALDALVAAEFRVGKVPASLRARAERVQALGRLMTETGGSMKSDVLVERTFAAMPARQKVKEPGRLRFIPRGGFRFADLVSIAAVLLLGVAVAWPVLTTARAYSQRGVCGANFASLASAFGAYTADHRDQLPMATASFGGSWMDVGTTPDKSNSANLFTLASQKYAGLDTLACPGNPAAERHTSHENAQDWDSLPCVSYSYYIMFGRARPSPDTSPRTIVLADKSPVVLRAVNHERVSNPDENSPNHAGRGQWALCADGSATWLTTPNVGTPANTDNIWLTDEQQQGWAIAKPILQRLPRGSMVGVPMMRGSELPATERDSFLGP